MIAVNLIGLIVPIATVLIVNRWSRRRPAAAPHAIGETS
jgi:Zn-dependent protease with chaperone function